MPYLFILFSYLLGSIPCGLLLAKGAGVDVRRAGSGNIGATNVNRLLGKKLGLLTLVGDMAKAVIPMAIASLLFRQSADRGLWLVLCGGAAFLGHIFPIYLKFNGGKGVATALGIFLFLEPLSALFCLLVFVGVVYVWQYISLGSLAAAVAMPLWIWLLNGSAPHVKLALFIGALIWLKHHDNIMRLLRHEEKSWKGKNKAGAAGNDKS